MILVSDFDGTITRHDFYQLAAPYMVNGERDYWADYMQGRITHFGAMAGIFSGIRCSAAQMEQILIDMQPDPLLAAAVERLRSAGWEVEIASAGCKWYIDRILKAAGVAITTHASSGTFHPERGLLMELPEVDKQAVVRAAQARDAVVAFAGDGPPDLSAAMLAPTELRFARGWLAQHLRSKSIGFRPYESWSEIAGLLTSPRTAS